MKKPRVLIPIPSRDFDPTEAAIPWKLLSDDGFDVTFATPEGKPATADERMVSGRELGVFAPILKADRNAPQAYADMIKSNEFMSPLAWSAAHQDSFDALVLPGGHAPGMREYLESQVLQELCASFFGSLKPVGAICHGVVLASRSRSADSLSCIRKYKTTALLESQEMTAWWLPRAWLKDYYRTYPETVEHEVSRSLEKPNRFFKGPLPFARDSRENTRAGFVVVDRNYVSARWPGDAHLFAAEFAKVVRQSLELNQICFSTILRADIASVWNAVSDSQLFGRWSGMKLGGPFVAGQTIFGAIEPTEVDEEIAKMQAPFKGKKVELEIGEIETHKAQQKFSFRWHPFAVDPTIDYSLEPMTLIEFKLQARGKETILEITESGFDQLPSSRRESAFKADRGGWFKQIELITRYLELQN